MELGTFAATCLQKLGVQPKVVTPNRIIKQSVKIAKQQAQDWGAKRKAEAPNHFIVFINKEDWDRYYCSNPTETAGRIANIIQNKLIEIEYSLCDYCQVELVLDHGLDRGKFLMETDFTTNSTTEESTTKQEVNIGEETVVLDDKLPYPSHLRTLKLA